jgi:hypothetical protein
MQRINLNRRIEMPFLNKSERELVKSVLAEILSDDDLQDQFNRNKKNQQVWTADSQAALLRQYGGILEEISAERVERQKRIEDGLRSGAIKQMRIRPKP